MLKIIRSIASLFKRSANWRSLLLTVFGIIYLVVGALVFKLVENDYEVIMKNDLFAQEEEIRLKYNMSYEDFSNLTIVIMELEPHRAGVQWGFSGSVYFAITVVTTIGYGHSTPQTTAGKLLCICYAIFGIPLWLVTFQAMGERINTGAKNLFRIVGRKMGFKVEQISHVCLIPFGILTCILTFLVGTMAFAHFENWSYLNSAYYCVMTLTTIGFGDYVALQKERSLSSQSSYVTFTLIYIMIGLAVIGAFLNLVVLRLMVTLPETPEHSVSGGSKRNSTQRSPNLSISSRQSQYGDINSPCENGDSHRSLKGGCQERCYCMEEGNYVRYRKCNQPRRETSLENLTINSQQHLDCWVSDLNIINSKQSKNVCKSCKKHIYNLCEDCRSLLFHCCHCWMNCCALCPCSDEELNFMVTCPNEDAPSSSNYPTNNFTYTTCNQELSSDRHTNQNEELTSGYRSSYIPDEGASEASFQNSTCIPEVTVSHIKVTIPDQRYGSNNTNSNNGEFSSSSHNPSNFLSPADCHFRRDRFGSGDSGYLGGAQSSSGNVSNHVEDDTSDSPKSSEPRLRVECKTRPVSLPPEFDQLLVSQIFSNSNFQLNDNESFSICDRHPASPNLRYSPLHEKNLISSELSVLPPNSFQRSFTSLRSSDNTWKHLRRHQLKREASISCHSDTEVGYNRSDELVTHDENPIAKTRESKLLPLTLDEKRAESLSVRNLYKLVSSRQRKRQLSASFSHQDSDDTSVSILNSGDWEDHNFATDSHQKQLSQSTSETIESLHVDDLTHTQESTLSSPLKELPPEIFVEHPTDTHVRSRPSIPTNPADLNAVKMRSYSDSVLTLPHLHKSCFGHQQRSVCVHSCHCSLHASHHSHCCVQSKRHRIHRHCFHHRCRKQVTKREKCKTTGASSTPHQEKNSACNTPIPHLLSNLVENKYEEVKSSTSNRSNPATSFVDSRTLFPWSDRRFESVPDDVFTDQTSPKCLSDNNIFFTHSARPIKSHKSTNNLSEQTLPCPEQFL